MPYSWYRSLQGIPHSTCRSHERSKMTRILQGNLNKCALAQILLRQRVFEDKIDICLISEQYLNIQDRPLCMLDIAGKLLEKLIQGRLRNDIDRAGGFASNQHGFRKGRSTIGAIQKVIETAREAWSGSLKARKVCLVLTLDIKNAFNSASWGNILDALEHKFDVEPENLRIVDDYLDERTLIAETTEGPQGP
ncbi:uncharacterized protein LOC141524578 [Cotesia typhae]|uniref:uncharacterized protein LOC141524578 n=1 Tax=Cotesia typhae TaxID=2053667 RepID=UPI003D69766A